MKTNNLMMTIVTSLNFLTLGCAQSAVNADRKLAQTAPEVYVFESGAGGFNTKTFFYDNGEEVVAFDTQFTGALAQEAIDYLHTKTNHKVTYAVVTHPNPDKFNGMSVFQKIGAKIIMSSKTASALQAVQDYKEAYFVKVAKMFPEGTYPKLGTPDHVFEGREELRLSSGEVIELSELSSPGVSSNQTVAYIPMLRALMVGDLVHAKAHAWLEGGIVNGKPTPTLEGWIRDLLEIDQRFAGQSNITVYGGRGLAGELHALVRAQIAYLNTANDLVAAYAKNLNGSNPDYSVLTKQFEAKFPQYQLSYMISYGVYGLLSSKL
jgi:glyoxylase-like metal-dependent hydrolase (beta-lactamase superfamily II)